MTTVTDAKKAWEDYCIKNSAVLASILQKHGFTLDEVQPHISGERFLMQAVTTTSGKKLILLGKDEKGDRVVIKGTSDTAGIKEITHERNCREILKKLDFAGEVFHTPEEVAYILENGYVITVQKFIEQPCSFLERPIELQFTLALTAFKGQESAHAATFKHRKVIEKVFGIRTKEMYLHTFASFEENIAHTLKDNEELASLLSQAKQFLTENGETIEQYSGFLTHTDFVPHNIRISADNTIYLLDHSSLTFGNKYEGWARFLNFMTLYNPALQKALETYVKDNRSAEEVLSLQLMRVYRLGEIIWYYVRTLSQSSGNLLALNTARIHFWEDVLSSVLKNEDVAQSVIENYTQTRDSLRSEDEKQRQKGLH